MNTRAILTALLLCMTYYLLFVLELLTRRIHFAGLTPSPDGPWMTQIRSWEMRCFALLKS